QPRDGLRRVLQRPGGQDGALRGRARVRGVGEGGHVGGRRVLGRRRLLREGGRCRRGGRHLLRGGLLAHRRGLGGVVVTVAAAAGQTERGEGEGEEEHGRSARHTILRVRACGGAELFWGSSDPTSTPVTEVAPAGGEGTAPSPP